MAESTPRLPFDSAIRLTSPYGDRVDPISGAENSWHGGLDLIGEDGKIRAAVGGVVAVSQQVTDQSNPTWEWGNYVCVLGDDGNYIYYCHMAARSVRAGERVAAGQLLGYIGRTGRATGVHLHFEVRDAKNRQINAADYLGIANEIGDVAASGVSGDRGDSIPSAWAQEAVEWARARGILYGDEQGNLHLREGCTREAAITFLWRALGGGQ